MAKRIVLKAAHSIKRLQILNRALNPKGPKSGFGFRFAIPFLNSFSSQKLEVHLKQVQQGSLETPALLNMLQDLQANKMTMQLNTQASQIQLNVLLAFKLETVSIPTSIEHTI